MKMKKPKAKDVDVYIAAAGRDAQATLNEVREVIKSAIPKAEESISWNVPFYRYCGHLAGFAVYKNHVSFGFCADLSSDDRDEFEGKGYKAGRKTVQLPFDQPVPVALIKRILKANARANAVKKAAKRQ